MPRGSKSSYTSKQKRQAQHIEQGYESRGESGQEAGRRAWATVNKTSGGGRRSGSGRGRSSNTSSARRGGRRSQRGGRGSASRGRSRSRS